MLLPGGSYDNINLQLGMIDCRFAAGNSFEGLFIAIYPETERVFRTSCGVRVWPDCLSQHHYTGSLSWAVEGKPLSSGRLKPAIGHPPVEIGFETGGGHGIAGVRSFCVTKEGGMTCRAAGGPGRPPPGRKRFLPHLTRNVLRPECR